QIAALSVQQLVFTAQAAAGKGNLPVHFVRSSGETTLWSMPINGPFTRPTRVGLSTWLTDLWINEPSVVDGQSATVAANTPVTVKGEASAHEANIEWEVTRSDGSLVSGGITTATVGAPDRGTFEFSINGLSAGSYSLKAFSRSMKDGQGELASDKIMLTVR
ncbi:MAG TPA: Gmad2 immunoglobulin-like domain-containing protein, partial [Phycicoccus sp.]|nr:Gmad2 immunoglobulin-like domain-containing protein [Phycicoccus sp.]